MAKLHGPRNGRLGQGLAVLRLDAAYVRDAAPADALPWKPRPTAI